MAFTHMTANDFLLETIVPMITNGFEGTLRVFEGEPMHAASMDVMYYDEVHWFTFDSDTKGVRRASESWRRLPLFTKLWLQGDRRKRVEGSSATLVLHPKLEVTDWWQYQIPFSLRYPDGSDLSDALGTGPYKGGVNLFEKSSCGDSYPVYTAIFPKDCLEAQIFNQLRARDRHRDGLAEARHELQKLSKLFQAVETA